MRSAVSLQGQRDRLVLRSMSAGLLQSGRSQSARLFGLLLFRRLTGADVAAGVVPLFQLEYIVYH
jgi:hypothetical protein